MTDPYFWTVAVIAVFLVALAKSGLVGSLGVVGVPLLTLIMPAREAAGMMLPILLVMDAFAVAAYRRDFDWSNYRVIVSGAIVGVGIGWALSTVVNDDMVLLGVGLITLLFVIDAVFPIRKKLQGRPPSKPWGRFWGGVAGFTSFVSHTGGPPFQIYVLPQKLSPAVFAGTTAWCFATINAIKLIPYYFLGQLSPGNLQLSLILAPVAVAGMLIGIYLVRRISVDLFYRIAYGLIFLLSLKLIWDGGGGVLGV
jgi:uncharacterized membrane protein YfcA